MAHRLLVPLLLVACSVDHTGLGPEGDAGPRPDAGPMADGGPGFDAGPGFDGGPAPDVPGVDVGPGADAGPDATSDVGPDVFDAGTDAGPGVDAGPGPLLTSATYSIVAHGGQTALSGENLRGLVGATVGGIRVAIEDLSDTGFRLRFSDEVPIGAQLLVVTDGVREASFDLIVVHLVVNELDEETNEGGDVRQFIEVATYVDDALDLSGYILVAFDGDGDQSFYALELGTTSPSGFFVVGDSAVGGIDATAPSDFLTNGTMAAAIYQRDSFANGTTATAEDLIDAVVYRSSGTEPDQNLSTIFLVEGGQDSANEDAMGRDRIHSLQRCGVPRRDNREWSVAPPTPNAVNTCSTAVIP